jgi:hypothetical protein
MTLLQKTAFGAALLTAAGASMFQAHQTSTLRDQIQALHQEHRSLSDQLSKLEQEHRNYKQQLSTLRNAKPPRQQPETAAKPGPKGVEPTPLPSAGLEEALDRACAEAQLGKREAALESIRRSISHSDIPRALAHLATRTGMNGVDTPLFRQLASTWAEADPNAAVSWAESLSDASVQTAALLSTLNGWTHTAPEAAAGYAAKMPAGNLQDAAIIKVAKEWSFRDARGAASWISTFPEGKLRDKAADSIIFWGQGQCPAAIADMLDSINSPELTSKHAEMLANIWLTRDSPAACAWIERSALPQDAKQRLLSRTDEQK